MYLISTKLADGSWAYALVTETCGARTLDSQEQGAYIKMLGDAAGYPWDWYWLLVRQAWERHNTVRAAMGAAVDRGVDEIVARMKAELGQAPAAAKEGE